MKSEKKKLVSDMKAFQKYASMTFGPPCKWKQVIKSISYLTTRKRVIISMKLAISSKFCNELQISELKLIVKLDTNTNQDSRNMAKLNKILKIKFEGIAMNWREV